MNKTFKEVEIWDIPVAQELWEVRQAPELSIQLILRRILGLIQTEMSIEIMRMWMKILMILEEQSFIYFDLTIWKESQIAEEYSDG